MQTFLPYADFARTAGVLDDRRLGKQRVEAFQILRALTWTTYGWKNHPAVRMWRGFVPALVCYGLAITDEWIGRGRADTVRAQLLEFTDGAEPSRARLRDRGQLPPWLGLPALHVSHRSALVRKDRVHYRPLFPDVPADLPYLWPPSVFPRWPVARPGTPALSDALAALGYAGARPGQAETVEALAAGRNVVLSLPVGGGGSATGLLAALVRPGPTLWVSPATGGEDGPAGTVPATSSAEAKDSPAEFVFLSPDRLSDPGAFAHLAAGRPDLVVVDDSVLLDGCATGQVLSAVSRLGSPPVLVITDSSVPALRRRPAGGRP